MENKRTIFVCVLLAVLFAVSLQAASSTADNVATAPPAPAPAPVMTKKECGNKCKVRCQKVRAHQDRCLNYCNDCCMLCKCVPSGQYGNKDECPCYRDRKNSKGGSKCP
ncbi:peamaclein [Cryptomeria japonica]|uniref:peamaclein n=1 Tax=Cryptomeria japonica TaxID=3369 RepID=UPI0027DAAC3D|nr:peamaclein [Cryptomeria japonica]